MDEGERISFNRFVMPGENGARTKCQGKPVDAFAPKGVVARADVLDFRKLGYTCEIPDWLSLANLLLN